MRIVRNLIKYTLGLPILLMLSFVYVFGYIIGWIIDDEIAEKVLRNGLKEIWNYKK